MRIIGFSTGALARGDFRAALGMLEEHPVRAIELSALRESEVRGLMASLGELQLERFEYVSIHAPSKLPSMSERELADVLSPCLERNFRIVVHPDSIRDFACWDRFGGLLCIENMDNRKPTGRTVDELRPFFDRFPSAGFCFDIAHARQVDGTMMVARELLREYGDRLVQIHLSEIDAAGHHFGLSVASVRSVRRIAQRIPEDVPIILESQVPAHEIELEMRMASEALSETHAGSSESAPLDGLSAI